MANKITLNGSLIWSDGVQTLKVSVSDAKDQEGVNALYNLQNIGTSAEAIVLGDGADPGEGIAFPLEILPGPEGFDENVVRGVLRLFPVL